MTRRLYHPGLFYSSLLAHLLAVSMALDFGTVGFLDLLLCPLSLPWDLDLSLYMDGCMMDIPPMHIGSGWRGIGSGPMAARYLTCEVPLVLPSLLIMAEDGDCDLLMDTLHVVSLLPPFSSFHGSSCSDKNVAANTLSDAGLWRKQKDDQV